MEGRAAPASFTHQLETLEATWLSNSLSLS